METLRTKLQFKTIPMIAISAHSRAGIGENLSFEGFNDFVFKPFKIEELMDKVRGYLG